MLKIGKLTIDSDVVLAPMAGYSDVGFRSLCAGYGAGITTTEMVSALGIKYENESTHELLYTEPNEHIKEVQLFGSNTDAFKYACESKALSKFDMININMGCPVPKIYKNGEGCALMGRPELARELICACVESTQKPVTVKFRLGLSADNINAAEFALMCEDAGAKCITVHGRTRDQLYSGAADWNEIAKVVEAVDIPVIANGDVCSHESYLAIKKHTGCSGVMIGRGALGRPWIFDEIIAGGGYSVNVIEVIEQHYSILFRYFDEARVVQEMRKHLIYYFKHGHGAKVLRAQLLAQNSYKGVIACIKEWGFNKD